MEELNRQLFLMINTGSQPTPDVLVAALLLAKYMIYGVPLLLAGIWIWGKHSGRAVALRAVSSIALALACNLLITHLWPHPRPFMIGLGNSFLSHKPEPSFPSDHATLFFALGMAMLHDSWRKTGSLILILGLAVGWARVYLGVHFPFDVFGALPVAFGSSWLAGFLWFRTRLGERVLVLLESFTRIVCRYQLS
jgi:undecaprenyl-diphosphatase